MDLNYQFVHPRLADLYPLYPLSPEATRLNHGNGIVVKLLGLGEVKTWQLHLFKFGYIVRVMRDISSNGSYRG
jgi:hypothetical protein